MSKYQVDLFARPACCLKRKVDSKKPAPQEGRLSGDGETGTFQHAVEIGSKAQGAETNNEYKHTRISKYHEIRDLAVVASVQPNKPIESGC